jgi:hypothetical protein
MFNYVAECFFFAPSSFATPNRMLSRPMRTDECNKELNGTAQCLIEGPVPLDVCISMLLVDLTFRPGRKSRTNETDGRARMPFAWLPSVSGRDRRARRFLGAKHKKSPGSASVEARMQLLVDLGRSLTKFRLLEGFPSRGT